MLDNAPGVPEVEMVQSQEEQEWQDKEITEVQDKVVVVVEQEL